MKAGITKKLISYLLPITALGIVPAVIFCLGGLPFTKYLPLIIFGALIMLAGLVLLIWSIRKMEKCGKGTLAPWTPASVLITDGPYRYIRNPMISGVVYCLFGMWMVAWNHWIIVWALFFFIGNTIYFKLFEERGLLRQFGDEYNEYRKKTPMWLPRFK